MNRSEKTILILISSVLITLSIPILFLGFIIEAIVILIVAVILLAYPIKNKVDRLRIEKNQKKAMEQMERDKQREQERWETEKGEVIIKLVDAIKEYDAGMTHNQERPYQTGLYGYLKAKFPNVEIEKRTGSSRPDIVINDRIAIEVKGATTRSELDSVTGKCPRYCRDFEEVIVVLFDVQVREETYEQWLNDLKRLFPNVTVVRK